MNLALLTRWKRIMSKTLPGVPMPCRAWNNWDYAKDKICDCGSICKIQYKSQEERIKIEKTDNNEDRVRHNNMN